MNIPAEFKDLVDLAVDNRLNSEQRQVMEGYLRFSERARMYYLEMMDLSSLLEQIHQADEMPRLMVVEDRVADQIIAVRLARESGFAVDDVASDGQTAIKKFLVADNPIVMLDMVLEGELDGLDTFRALRKINPDVRVFICTGYTDSFRVQQALDEGVRGVIKKPYSVSELAVGLMTAIA